MSGELSTDFAPAMPIAPDALDRAKQNLRNNFKVVGVTERFDETLVVMKKTFGWGDVFYLRANTTLAKKRAGVISPEIRDIILKNNELDFELWKFAGTLLDRSLANYGSSFKDDLRRFRRTNALYQAAKANPVWQAVYRVFPFAKALARQSRRLLGNL